MFSVVDKKLKIVCDKCGNNNHVWKEVYVSNNARLEKLKGMLITWCDKKNEHVLYNYKKN